MIWSDPVMDTSLHWCKFTHSNTIFKMKRRKCWGLVKVLLFLLLTSSAPLATEFIQVDSLRGENLAHLMDDHLSFTFVDKTTSFCSFSPFIFPTFPLLVPIILSISRTCPPHLCWGQTQFSGRAKLCWISIELLIAAYQQIRLLPARRNLNTGVFFEVFFLGDKICVLRVQQKYIGRCSL